MNQNRTLLFATAALAAGGCFTHLSGATPGSRFGFSVLALGTLDNDVYADYAVGAPWDNTTGNTAGAVYAYLGSASELKFDPAPGGIHFTGLGVDSGEKAGFSMAAADFDGDGNVDLAVGAPSKPDPSGAATGAVYLVSGEHVRSGGVFSLADAECVIYGLAVDDDFGWAIAAGDLNGDGFADLAVGAPGESGDKGGVVAFHLDPGVFAHCPETSAADVYVTEVQKARLGHSLLIADTDGDGLGQLFAGAPYRDAKRGRVYGLDGSTVNYAWSGVAAGDRAGWSLGRLDVDQDALDDLAIGAPLADRVQGVNTLTDSGAAYIVNGAGMASGSLGSAAVVDAAVLGQMQGDRLGWSLGRLEYLSSNYSQSLLVGAPGADANGSNSGSLFVLSRDELALMPFPGTALTNQVRVNGPSANAYFGFSVAGVDDVDASGVSDAMAGAPFTTNGDVILGAI